MSTDGHVISAYKALMSQVWCCLKYSNAPVAYRVGVIVAPVVGLRKPKHILLVDYM